MVKYLDNNSGFAQWNANKNATTKKSMLGSFLWWVVLFIAAWWAVGAIMSPKKATTTTESDTMPVLDLSAVPAHTATSDKITATVRGLRVSDVVLADYAQNAQASDGERVTLLSGDNNFAEIGVVATGTSAPTPETIWKKSGDAFTWRNSDGVEYRRTVTVDGYLVTVSDEIKNKSGRDITVTPYARVVRDAGEKSSGGVYTGMVAYVNSDIEHSDWYKLDKKSYAYSTTNGFAGFADQYWETVVQLDSPDQTIRAKKVAQDAYQTDIAAAAVSVPAGGDKTITTHIFAGPRDQNILAGVSGMIAGIDETVDYGWFWFLARPMLWALNGLYSIVGNYGIAIILFTLLLRLAIWPLTRKSYTSMIAMQKMQPEMVRIQKLYANDKMRLQMEMMRLYQTHKTSPMSGCLPMLIQIPIFFALYKALLVSVPMRSAGFLWISDLAAMDPYFILPILMGATMWWQSRLQTVAKTASGNDAIAQTQRVMKWMPVIFTLLFAWMPAGLVLYWTVSNLFGIAQMQIIKRVSK